MSNQNIKPGDMCIVVGNCRTPGLSGRVVEVVREHITNETFTDVTNSVDAYMYPDNPAWVCKSIFHLPWWIDNKEIFFFLERPIFKSLLIKISDPDIDISETEDMQIEKTKELENA